MPEVRLDGKLVKDVSRSFYLTLKFLPKTVRAEISLAYLLARASDTIADTEAIPLKERLFYLEAYEDSLSQGRMTTAFIDCNERALPLFVENGERVLMESISLILEAYFHLPIAEKALINSVIKVILSGQKWDLTFFSEEKEMSYVESEEQTLEYAYKVAGCVGEFWTEMLILKKVISPEKRSALLEKGKFYGIALQLINILRDVEKDRLKGRCYLPWKELEESQYEAEHRKWVETALGYLQNGFSYADLMPRGRAKFATLLPALIGQKTLILLKGSQWSDLKRGVKVDRREIKNSLVKGVLRSLK